MALVVADLVAKLGFDPKNFVNGVDQAGRKAKSLERDLESLSHTRVRVDPSQLSLFSNAVSTAGKKTQALEGDLQSLGQEARKRLDPSKFSEYINAADRAGKSTRNLEDDIGSLGSTGEKVRGKISALQATVVSFVAAFVTKNIIDAAAQMEMFEARLTTVMGSATRAKSELVKLTDFAKATPFELTNLVETRIQLESVGITGDKVIKTLGDTAAAFGRDIMETIPAVIGMESEVLRRFGIDVEREGGRAVFRWKDRLGEMRNETVIGSRDMQREMLLSIWNDRYEGAMEKMGGQWKNLTSNITDTTTQLAASIGKEILPMMKEVASSIIAAVDATREWFKENKAWINLGVSNAYNLIKMQVEGVTQVLGTLSFALGPVFTALAKYPVIAEIGIIGLIIGRTPVAIAAGLSAVTLALLEANKTVGDWLLWQLKKVTSPEAAQKIMAEYASQLQRAGERESFELTAPEAAIKKQIAITEDMIKTKAVLIQMDAEALLVPDKNVEMLGKLEEAQKKQLDTQVKLYLEDLKSRTKAWDAGNEAYAISEADLLKTTYEYQKKDEDAAWAIVRERAKAYEGGMNAYQTSLRDQYDAETRVSDDVVTAVRQAERDKVQVHAAAVMKMGIVNSEYAAAQRTQMDKSVVEYRAAGVAEVDIERWTNKEIVKLNTDRYQKIRNDEITDLQLRLQYAKDTTSTYGGVWEQISLQSKLTFEKMQLDARNWSDAVGTAIMNFAQGVSSTFQVYFRDVLKGHFGSLKDLWQGVLDSMLNAFSNMIAQMVTSWAISGLGQLLFGTPVTGAGSTAINALNLAGSGAQLAFGGGTSGLIGTGGAAASVYKAGSGILSALGITGASGAEMAAAADIALTQAGVGATAAAGGSAAGGAAAGISALGAGALAAAPFLLTEFVLGPLMGYGKSRNEPVRFDLAGGVYGLGAPLTPELASSMRQGTHIVDGLPIHPGDPVWDRVSTVGQTVGSYFNDFLSTVEATYHPAALRDAGYFAHGGIVGDSSVPRRFVPAAAFWGAPRAEMGLKVGEFPVIAHAGERVLSPSETEAYERGGREVHIHLELDGKEVGYAILRHDDVITQMDYRLDKKAKRTYR